MTNVANMQRRTKKGHAPFHIHLTFFMSVQQKIIIFQQKYESTKLNFNDTGLEIGENKTTQGKYKKLNVTQLKCFTKYNGRIS